MIRRSPLAAGGVVASVASLDVLTRRVARRLLEAPRVGPDEPQLRPALDALGGEVVRVRARDGLRLSARWLDAEPYHDRFTWTQKWPRANWTLAYQGNLHEVPQADFELLQADMEKAAKATPAKA